MQISLRIAIWNANGLSNHTNENFIKNSYIDIFLFYFRINVYEIVTASHPDGGVHCGAAILIKHNIKYEIVNSIEKNFL